MQKKTDFKNSAKTALSKMFDLHFSGYCCHSNFAVFSYRNLCVAKILVSTRHFS
jgi:hypothetical protein